ncbi:MAG: hypothetical protein ABI830_03550 [Pseudolabrys sp.]
MKLSSFPLFAFAAAFGLAFLALAAPAQAFTIEDQGQTSGAAAAQFGGNNDYPRDPRYNSGQSNSNGSTSTLQQGNTTFQFGGRQSFDQRFSKDSMFDQVGRPSGER